MNPEEIRRRIMFIDEKIAYDGNNEPHALAVIVTNYDIAELLKDKRIQYQGTSNPKRLRERTQE